ncbi:MAG: serine protease [Minisyncoccia bacterium]
MTTMEDLTKTQIILLTLLVSFVTSIATGIITASLLAEAPLSVTQTINRVVERTIEKVNPTSTNSTLKEVTVVKEEDSIMNSINSSTQSLVRIKEPIAVDGTQAFYAIGAIVSKTGLVISDKRGVILGGTYSITLADGSILPAIVAYVSDTERLAVFKIVLDTNHQNGLTPISFSSKELQLGQSVIAMEGREKNVVGIGRVTGLNTRTEKNSKGVDVTVPYSVETDIDPTNEIQGSLLLNLSGELVGIKTSNDDLIVPARVYTAISPIRQAIEKTK